MSSETELEIELKHEPALLLDMDMETELRTEQKLTLTHPQETRKSRKMKKNSGQMYVTSSGEVRPEKVCRPLSNCRKKCKERINFADQKQIFNKYWQLGSHKLRRAFLSNLIETVPKKSVRLKENSKIHRKRMKVFQYYLEIGNERINVCQKCFLRTFDESTIIKTISQKRDESDCTPVTSGVPKKTKAERSTSNTKKEISDVYSHIHSFPKYLATGLTIRKMHNLYLQLHAGNPVSFRKYKELFLTTGIRTMPKSVSSGCCKKCKKSIEEADGGRTTEEATTTEETEKPQEIQLKEDVVVKQETDEEFILS